MSIYSSTQSMNSKQNQSVKFNLMLYFRISGNRFPVIKRENLIDLNGLKVFILPEKL